MFNNVVTLKKKDVKTYKRVKSSFTTKYAVEQWNCRVNKNKQQISS